MCQEKKMPTMLPRFKLILFLTLLVIHIKLLLWKTTRSVLFDLVHGIGSQLSFTTRIEVVAVIALKNAVADEDEQE
jgi:hypothetical protein